MLSTTTAATTSSSSSSSSLSSSSKLLPTTNRKMMMSKCHRSQRCQKQYHNGKSSLSSTSATMLLSSSSLSSSTTSFYGLNKWLWTAVLFGLLIVTASAIDENSKSSPASTVSSSLSPRDEIYIDDEGIDGSGRGGIHDDLEKDPDFSGSGFGPDDEDSDSDYRHQTHKHQTAGGINTQGGTNIHDLDTNSINSLPPETKIIEQTTGNEVLIMNANDDDRTASFFAQPGILAAVIGGAVVGLLCAILVVMFIVYRMRKKDEGSYALDEPKRSPAMNSYAKNATNREFYA